MFEVLAALQNILQSTLRVTLNTTKYAILAPQLHIVQVPATFLRAEFNQYVALRDIPICSNGIVLLGIPIGDREYVRTNLETRLAEINDMGPRVLQLCNS